jgi:hypothetical protein
MLRLLPKDVVNYIYTIVHRRNTQDIINEYIKKVEFRTRGYKFNENNAYIQANLKYTYYRFNNRDFIQLSYYHKYDTPFYIYNKFGVKCAKIPERYVYSLTRQEFKLMQTK